MKKILILFVGLIFTLDVSAQQQNSCVMPGITDQALLNEISRTTWTYISSDWATDNNLPWSWRSPTMSGGDYVNPTEIGLYLLSYLGAYEMRQDWSPTLAVVEAEVNAVLDQLKAWQTDTQAYQPHGTNAYNNSVFFQWYWINWNPPVVGANVGTNQIVPSIDNAFLAASLITIREWSEANNLPAIAEKANDIVQRMDFLLWYDPLSQRFTLGAVRNPQGGIQADYYSNENRIINFIARTLGQLSPTEYKASLGALTQLPETYMRPGSGPGSAITVARTAWDGSYFTYIAPALFIRETQSTYGRETIEPATRAQIAYAEDEGYTAWGLSDSYDIGTGGYLHQGAPPAFTNAPLEQHAGVVTPHVSGLALITAHRSEAIVNFRTLCTDFPAVYDTQYGFRDSVMVDPSSSAYGQASDRFSVLAQGWLFLGLANEQTDFIWEYFYRDPGVVAAHHEMFAAPQLMTPANGALVSSDNVVFQWQSAPGAIRYEMQLGRAASQMPTVADANTLRYVPPSSLLPTNYYWHVRAIYADGTSSVWSEIRSIDVHSSPQAAPIRNHYNTPTPTLTWGRISWATGYDIQVAHNPAFTSPLVYSTIVADNTFAVTIPLLYDGTYYWRVRAKRGTSSGPWSQAEVFTVTTVQG